VLLLPAFFAFTGLRTQIGLVSGGGEWLLCLLIIAIASLGKFGGAAVAARLTGLGWRDSAALGVLMNTRGLMELIVLNIGYELGVISPTLFAMLVLMALVTTFMTTPILHLLESREELLPEEARSRPAAKLRVVRPARQGILVPVSNPQKVGVLMELALSATGAGDSPPRVVAFVHRPAGGVRSGIREVEQRVVPRSEALSAALEYALEREPRSSRKRAGPTAPPATSCGSPARPTRPGSCSASIARSWAPTSGAAPCTRSSKRWMIFRSASASWSTTTRNHLLPSPWSPTTARTDGRRSTWPPGSHISRNASCGCSGSDRQVLGVMRNCKRCSGSLRRGWRA